MRAADQAGDQEEEDGEGDDAHGDQQAKQRRRKDLDPSSTLADPDSIKAKAPELSFETDPLFVRTSALFDKGGAEGEQCMYLLHLPAHLHM